MTYFLLATIGILSLAIIGLFSKLRKRKGLAGGLALAVIVSTIALYSLWSEVPRMLYADLTGTVESENETIEEIEAHLTAQGGTVENWVMLAQIYMDKERTADALRAYTKAESRGALSPNAMLDYAHTRFVHNGQVPDSKMEELVAMAIQQEPENLKALWWNGFISYTKEDYQSAVADWTNLRTMLESGTQDNSINITQITQMIDDANTKIVDANAAPKATAQSAKPAKAEVSTPSPALPQVTVTVELSNELSDRITGDETLFVYARAVSGPPMPLAIKRMTAKQLPVKVTLTNKDAMMAQMNLSTFDQVKVIARISKSGQAKMRAGDLFTESDSLSPSADPAITLTIDRIAQ